MISLDFLFLLKSCILYSFTLIKFYFSSEIFNIFHYWIIRFLNCKQYVGAGINTRMSISDGLVLSIFCRKMEKARSMRKEMDGKAVYFPPCRHFDFDAVFYKSTSLYLYIDLACKQLCFPPGKGIDRKNESTKDTIVDSRFLYRFLSNDDNIQYSWFPNIVLFETVKNQLISRLVRRQSIINRWPIVFP